MSSFFFSYHLENGVAHFDEHEVRHLKVMRYSVGMNLKFTDGKGNLYMGELVSKDMAKIVKRLKSQPLPSFELSLLFSPVRWERTKFAVEKAVELGATRILFWNTERTTRKKTESKLVKISFVARDAMKQCGVFYLPEIMNFEDSDISRFSTKIFLDTKGECKMNEISFSQSILVAIGPEGGFTQKERISLKRKGFVSVQLGKRVLRTETAVVVILTLVNYLKGVF